MSGILNYFQASRLPLEKLQEEPRVTETTNLFADIEGVIYHYGAPLNDPVLKPLHKLSDFVEKMKHNFAVEVYLTNHDPRQKDQDKKTERDRKVESLKPKIKEVSDFIVSIIKDTKQDAKATEDAIIEFRNRTVGRTTFYATQLGRELLKLAALATLIFLGVEIANHFFPPETIASLNPNASLLEKALKTVTSAQIAGGTIAGVTSFVTYRFTGFGDRFFRSFTSYEQEFVEAAQDIEAARKSNPTPSGGSQRM